MKVMKLALLGTAALAAASLSANANDLSDLKAQIEALNSRIATLEAAPSVPAGYSLMTMSKAPAIVAPSLDVDPAYLANAQTISILPTADVPASTNIQWSGFVRAALVYDTFDVVSVDGFTPDDDNLDIFTRAELKVSATTDTAVGEIGVFVKLRSSGEGLSTSVVTSPEYWGWWKMTPELTFAGGYSGSVAGIGFGYDGKCNCYLTDNATAGYGHNDKTQFRVSYASGPLSAAIALEDDSQHGGFKDDTFGVAGELKWSGDAISAEIAGGMWDGGSNEDAWNVGVGAGYTMDMFTISASAGLGEGHDGFEFWKANVLVSANLSEAIHAEIGFNHYNDEVDGFDENAVLAGLYWDPVSQLTIGLEGEWINPEGSNNNSMRAALVTVFRF